MILVTQAELYDEMCRNSLLTATERVQHRSRCKECLSEAAAITVELLPDDYYYLDPYLGVGASISHLFCRLADPRVGDKVCWNRAINLLAEEQPNEPQPSSDVQMALVPVSSFTAETLDAQLSVFHLARRSLGMGVCLVPSGPKTLCSQLMEYRRTNNSYAWGDWPL